jgi:hypothetical protein
MGYALALLFAHIAHPTERHADAVGLVFPIAVAAPMRFGVTGRRSRGEQIVPLNPDIFRHVRPAAIAAPGNLTNGVEIPKILAPFLIGFALGRGLLGGARLGRLLLLPLP